MSSMRTAVVFVIAWGLSAAVSEAATDISCELPSASANDIGRTNILELLKGLPINTKWAELPTETRTKLQTFADERLAKYRSHWAAEALEKKEAILLQSPTLKMTLAINRYFQTSYKTFLPATFTLADIKLPALAQALVRNYLGAVAAARASLTYPNGILPNCDWDGETAFDSVRLPDKQTYEDIKAYNKEVVKTLASINDTLLNALEKKLKQYALYAARSGAEGSRGDSYGSDYMEQACDIAELNYDILSGYEYEGNQGRSKIRPKIFASDEDVLREANALYLHNTQLKWLDIGTRASALSYCATRQDRIKEDVGDPATNNVAKGLILLQNWWVERVMATSAQKCSIYSAQDRTQIWDAFSADQQFNNDGSSSIESYQTRLSKYKADKTSHYRDSVRVALRQVFPDDTVLTPDQRMRVVAAFDKRIDFGVFMKGMSEELDAAQGVLNGPASQLWATTVKANVEHIGGGYAPGQPVHQNESDQIKAMFEEVKSWVALRYQGYPIDIRSLFAHISIEINTKNYPFTDNGTAKIEIGVGTERSKAEYYSWLLHELRHAVMYAWLATAPDRSRVKSDEGPAWEGSGMAVEDLLLFSFLKEALRNDTALSLYALDYGIRDARFAGTTDATLQKYLRSSCAGSNDLDTVEFTKGIARSYGLLEELTDTVVERAHAGTQYLQYIWSGSYMLDEIAYLQTEVDPSNQHLVDPYILFACGLNTPRRDKPYTDELRSCMKL